jgi:hypothetical protein
VVTVESFRDLITGDQPDPPAEASTKEANQQLQKGGLP